MILFSTVLRLNKNFTQDDFIKTVIEWNQNSPHPENVISGIVWNGERSARSGRLKFSNEIGIIFSAFILI